MKIPNFIFAVLILGIGGITTAQEKSPFSARFPPPNEVEKVPYLGVFTQDLAPALSLHLEIDEGFGVQVAHVAEGSPAQEKGVKAHDILTKFDDQLLTTPQHLATLVRSRKKDEKVTLTLIRKGVEKTVEVTLSQHEVPVVAHHQEIERWQEAMSQNQGNLVLPARKPPAISVSPGFPVKVFGTKGVVKIDNGHGEVTIQDKDGQHTITIQDSDGKVVYDGDFDPEKGIESLPKEAQEHLKKMKLDDLKVYTPGAPIPNLPKGIKPDSKKDDKKSEVL